MKEEDLRAKLRETPAGKLLVRAGFEPFDTESAARRVAKFAAEEIERLRKENEALAEKAWMYDELCK